MHFLFFFFYSQVSEFPTCVCVFRTKSLNIGLKEGGNPEPLEGRNTEEPASLPDPSTCQPPPHPTHSYTLLHNLPVRSIHAASFPSHEPPTRRDPGAPQTALCPSPPPQRQRLLQTNACVCECAWTSPPLPTCGGTGFPLLDLSVRAQTHYAHTQTQAVQTHTHTYIKEKHWRSLTHKHTSHSEHWHAL